MNSVTFPEALGGNGQTYTDDADPDTGLDGLGYTTRFIPCLQQAVVMGLSAQNNAQACADYVQQCQTLREAVGNDRLAVAADRLHVNQQKAAVDTAAGQVATNRQAVADDRAHVDQQKGLVDGAAEQVSTDRQAVADDRAHVDQQKDLVDGAAEQVATDRQAVSENRQASEQAALAAGEAADASLQAKNDAQALYGDLAAIDTAKTAAQQAATTATEKAEEASTLLENAGTAYSEDTQDGLYDATPDRLSKVGAFGGYGRVAGQGLEPYPLSNMNSDPTNVPAGEYSFTNSALGGTNSNPPFSTPGVVEVSHNSVARATVLTARNSGDVNFEGHGDVYERVWRVTTWHTPWRKVGEAKYRDVVGGPGALFALEDGGSVTLTGDLHAVRPTGNYYSLNAANQPAGNGHVFWSQARANTDFARYLYINQTSESVIRAFIGGRHSGVWKAGVELFHKENILGTVSQAGGILTGAVIERGSNDDGEYVKFADGTFMAQRVVPAISTDNMEVVYNLPLSGIVGSVAHSLSCRVNINTEARRNAVRDHMLGGANVWSLGVKQSTNYTLPSNIELSLFAYGRWY